VIALRNTRLHVVMTTDAKTTRAVSSCDAQIEEQSNGSGEQHITVLRRRKTYGGFYSGMVSGFGRIQRRLSHG
jgi:hypothetical protein